MAKRTFYAAKVNIHGNIFSPNLEELINEFIPQAILKSAPLKIGTWNWTFTDVYEKNDDNQRLIIGNVTKSKQADVKVRIDSITEQRKTDFELAHTAFFVYNPEGEILVHESTGAISDFEFRKLFTRLLSRDPHIGEVKVLPIPEPRVIRQELRSIQKITHLEFHLIHPNPGREEFNQYQEIIKENKLKELEIKMVNKNGFIISESHVSGGLPHSIENGIELIEAGYGDVEIKGFDEEIRQGRKKKTIVKKKRSFSSKKSVRLIKTTEYDKERLLSRIFSFILDVKKKARGESDKNEK
jgi:hypothetical protein